MTNGEVINWIINISADIGKAEHRDLWHYEQALSEIREMLESAQPETFEWCHDCKEYDQERHCCPRWTKVIRQTVEELKDSQPDQKWNRLMMHLADLQLTYSPNWGANGHGDEKLYDFVTGLIEELKEWEEGDNDES